MLGRLGVSAEVVDRRLLSRVPLRTLQNLGVAYGAALAEANKFSKDVSDGRIEIPPFGYNSPPRDALRQLRKTVGRTYWRAPGEPRHPTHGALMQGLMNPRTSRGVKLGRLLHGSEAVRRTFEKTAGAKVVLDGRNDGKVSLRVPQAGVTTSAMTGAPVGPPSRERINELLAAMDAAVLEQAQKLRPGNSGGTFTELGKGNLLGPSLTSSSEGEDEEGGTQSTASALDGLGYTPGGVPIGPGNPINQPDARIESVDVGTLHLKRLMDKRDQMYDLFRQVNDKHNQSANTAVNNLKA